MHVNTYMHGWHGNGFQSSHHELVIYATRSCLNNFEHSIACSAAVTRMAT